MKTSNTSLRFNEIASLINQHQIDRLFSVLENAMANVEKKFYLKVTRSRNPVALFTVIVNGRVRIDLVHEHRDREPTALAVSPKRNIDASDYDEIAEDNQSLLVPKVVFEQIVQEASAIYKAYCQDGFNFGWIPCAWYEESTLVQLISQQLWYKRYFQERLASPHIELGTDWSREECP